MPRCTRCLCREADPPFRTCAKCRKNNAAERRAKRERVRREWEGAEKAPEDFSPRAAHQVRQVGAGSREAENYTLPQPPDKDQPAPVAQPVERLPYKQEGSVSDHGKISDHGEASSLILVVPDIHAPRQDEAAYCALLALMAAHKFAELVLLGDAVELVSCSWFGGPETLTTYKAECQQARGVLKRMLSLHSGPVTLTIGNHDLRGDQKVERSAPQLHGSIVDEMDWPGLGVTVIPEAEQPISRGKLRLLHGHQDTGRFPPINYAKKIAELYGLPGVSVVFGHVHKDQSHSRPMHGGPSRAYGLGCLEKRPTWLKSCDSWTHSVAVADPESGSVQVLPIVDGVLWFGGRRFTAREAS